jgi:DNA-binding CsgD family transcriptional regulator
VLLIPNHPFIQLSEEFADLCKPLADFHINHFTYQKQFNDGSQVSLSNKPQWIADYYNLQLYQTSLFEEKPSNYKATFNVWVGEYDLDVYRHGRSYYNTAHSITITEPCHDGCEHYLFSTPPEYQQAIQFLANNIDILYRFILHLKDRGARIFKTAHRSRLIIQRSFENDPDKPFLDLKFHQKMLAAKKSFLKHMPIHRYVFEYGEDNGIKLSHREISCIKYLLQNKTAAETAELMNVSRRTIESYLDNIKVKLNCHSKVDLIQKVVKNKYLFSLLL